MSAEEKTPEEEQAECVCLFPTHLGNARPPEPCVPGRSFYLTFTRSHPDARRRVGVTYSTRGPTLCCGMIHALRPRWVAA